MAVEHTQSRQGAQWPARATTVHISRSVARTSLTVAILVAALVLILVLR